MSDERKLTCASFFAGVGGIDLAFEQTGKFEVIYANEIDPYPVKTYELNFDIKVDNRSICDVKPEEIPDFDVMLAGFPCTDISVAGRRQGLQNDDGTVTRSGLFFELIRIAKVKKPRIIFLENVKHLANHKNGETFNIILDALRSTGYENIQYKVMNPREYGNCPQNRDRIYILAFRDKEDAESFKFPEPIPLTTTLHDVIDFDSKLDEKYYYRKGKYKSSVYEDFEASIDDPDCIYRWRSVNVRKHKKGTIPTLTAHAGTGGHNVFVALTKYGIRKMTPREYFNAQGYPQDFKLPENMSEGRLYKQAGNSVCVSVIKRIADNIVV